MQSVEDYRIEVTAQMKRILVMMGGDNNVTDKDDPNHYLNSIMGRLDKEAVRREDLEVRVASGFKLLTESVTDLREEVKTNTFGWPNVLEFVKKHWFKIASLSAFGLYFLYKNDLLP